jgi:hypothetical protein
MGWILVMNFLSHAADFLTRKIVCFMSYLATAGASAGWTSAGGLVFAEGIGATKLSALSSNPGDVAENRL